MFRIPRCPPNIPPMKRVPVYKPTHAEMPERLPETEFMKRIKDLMEAVRTISSLLIRRRSWEPQ